MLGTKKDQMNMLHENATLTKQDVSLINNGFNFTWENTR